MAVHDEIFYQMAVAEGVKLDVTEQEYLENDESDSGLIQRTGRENNWGFQRKNWILKWRKQHWLTNIRVFMQR